LSAWHEITRPPASGTSTCRSGRASQPALQTAEDLADFYWRRAEFPGAVWAWLVLAACLDAWLAPEPPPASLAGDRAPADVSSFAAFAAGAVTDIEVSRIAAAPLDPATPSTKEHP
jgi:hypothetical protein